MDINGNAEIDGHGQIDSLVVDLLLEMQVAAGYHISLLKQCLQSQEMAARSASGH